MTQIDIDLVKKKSISGIVALTSRTFVLQIIAFVATFLLTIFLSPSTFGVFYVVSAFISFLGYFSDIGLAAALIQKKEELTDEDLRTTFTIQQLLVSTGVGISMVFSGYIASFYSLDQAGLTLFRALILSFFLSSLKTIPSILLERRLDFQKLVFPQIAETVVFYAIAVALAWAGYGISSFTYAVIFRGLVGLILIYIISPWKISLGISRPVAVKLLRYGLPFQANSFLALLKDDLLTVFLGKVLPFAQVGYIGWAKKWAEIPLRLIMDSVVRVTFPAFSRLQHDKKHLASAIEKTIFGLAVSIFPIMVGLIFFIEPLISFIPKYSKWEPALFSFYLFAIASTISSLSTPLTNALNALGRVKTTLSLMVMWTVSTWIVTSIGIYLFGFNGVALSLLLISFTIIIVIRLVKKIADFSFMRNISYPFLAGCCQAILYFVVLTVMPTSVPMLIGVGALGLLVYSGIIWKFEKTRMSGLLVEFSLWKR